MTTTRHAPTLFRAFPTQLERVGRQLTGRLVPYDVATDVLDELESGELDIYREGFRSGAFGPQTSTREKGVLTRIHLRHRHDDNGLGFLGTFVALRDAADGLYGDVAVPRSRADDVEDLLAAGVNELSIEFRLPRKDHTVVDEAGVRWRTRAHLDQVALEPKGAYRSAQVLAFRSEVEDELREQAEADAAASQSETDDAEAQALAAAEELAQADRRARWDALTSRLDVELERQDQLVREYGVTIIGGYDHHRR